MWAVLALVFVVGGFLLFSNSQQVTQQPGIGGGPGILPKSLEIQLDSVNKEQINQSGRAVFEERGGRVVVTVAVNRVEGLNNQPAHIHAGNCPGVGEVIFPLNNVVNGQSVTEIDTTLDQLRSSGNPMALNIHKSTEEVTTYTACGNLPR